MSAPKNRCKTCYQNEGSVKLKIIMLETKKNLKLMISKCVPQLASNLNDHDVICKECLKNLLIVYKFIEGCILADTQFKKDTNIEISEEISLLSDSSSDDCESKITVVKHDPLELTTEFANTTVKIEPNINTNELNKISMSEESHQPVIPTESEVSVAKTVSDSNLDDSKMTVERTEPKRFKDLLELLNIGNLGQMAAPQHDRIRYRRTYLVNQPIEIASNPHKERYLLKNEKKTTTNPIKTKNEMKCLICNEVAANNSSLWSHMLKKHKEPYKCIRCGDEFSHLKFLYKHGRSHDPPPEPRVYICNVCQATFSDHKAFAKHEKLHPSWLCELCGKAFVTQTKLINHKGVHTQIRDFMCYKCGQRVRSNNALRNHMISHEEKYKLQCEVCGKMCQTRRRIKLHMLTHYEKQFKCDQCNKMFVDKASLMGHIRLCHLKIKPYQCDECDERFGRKDYLRNHKRLHITGNLKRVRQNCNGPFICNICKKEFRRKELLKAHFNSHLRVRRYECSSCDLTFPVMNSLKRHEKIHRDGVKFRCIICHHRMTSQEQLDEHMSRHKLKYKCTVCSKGFGKRYLMESHRRQQHPLEDLIIQDSIRKKL